MSDGGPKVWIDHYDLNLGVEGGDQDTLEDVRENFDDLLEDAVERDPKLGEDVDEHVSREVQ
ncbi:hypothetical protein [Natrinema pallidum]|uniref:hypothetical protein n=1 Tax=Natrinema pallidum TaxID=69527 RepID=UPI003750CFB6